MKVLRRTGSISQEALGSDNTLMIDPRWGPYMIKDADFKAKPVQNPIDIYPITQESVQSGMLGVYSAMMTAEDYRNVPTLHIE